MALVQQEYCPKCEKETQHVNRVCVYCGDRERRKKIASWNALTVNEKLQDLRRRVEKLEAGPLRY